MLSEIQIRKPLSQWEEFACGKENFLIQWQVDNVVTALFPNGSVWKTEFIYGEWQPSNIIVPVVEP